MVRERITRKEIREKKGNIIRRREIRKGKGMK